MSASEQSHNPADSLGTASDFSVHTGASVASLDSPLVQQTKTEIRKLAAEIAQLAHSERSVAEFLDGFLAKLSLAMGATGAAVWRISEGSSTGDLLFTLWANHSLPTELLFSTSGVEAAQSSHWQILQCVAKEKQPILVPPQTVTLDEERPANPIDEALVIVPVVLERQVLCLIEVSQRACGGPAAQRGYLRFAAQMADLMADFFRRRMLAQYAQDIQRMEQAEHWILKCAAEANLSARYKLVADGLQASLGALQVIVYQKSKWRSGRLQVRAFTQVAEFDPRSEIAERLQAFHQAAAQCEQQAGARSRFYALPKVAAESETEQVKETQGAVSSSINHPWHALDFSSSLDPDAQGALEQLCVTLGCESVMHLDLDLPTQMHVLASFENREPFVSEFDSLTAISLSPDRVERLRESAAGLLSASRLPGLAGSTQLAGKSGRAPSLRAWSLRLVLACGLMFVAWLPVPQQVRVAAYLEPTSKYEYSAPMQSVVEDVLVDEGDFVTDQQILVRLHSQELEYQFQSLTGKLQASEVERDEVENRLSRAELSNRERYEVERHLNELEVDIESGQQLLKTLKDQQQKLAIRALGRGQVATWNLKNRLLNNPVEYGELLMTTFDPEGPWRLQVEIPENRMGLVMSAMQQSESGVDVQFSLVSHPESLLGAKLDQLASQVVSAGTSGQYFLLGYASLDASDLPLRHDGAIANATIDCGTVPAIWLVLRDAYWAVRSRLQLYM